MKLGSCCTALVGGAAAFLGAVVSAAPVAAGEHSNAVGVSARAAAAAAASASGQEQQSQQGGVAYVRLDDRIRRR